MQRVCKCERWSFATLETAANTIMLSLEDQEQYSLYDIGTTSATNWAKLTMSAAALNPGAVELEFWAATDDVITDDVIACPGNPRQSAASVANCPVSWNNFTIGTASGVMYADFAWAGNDPISQLGNTTALNSYSYTLNTAGWPNSFIGFKVLKYPVRATVHGDCRSTFQGGNIHGTVQGGVSGRVNTGGTIGTGRTSSMELIERACVMLKWTACNAGSCLVKKLCELDDPEGVTTSDWGGTGALAEGCMQTRCSVQCGFA